MLGMRTRVTTLHSRVRASAVPRKPWRQMLGCQMRCSSHKAIVAESFGPPDVLQLKEVPMHGSPMAGQVLVKIYSSGLNPSDTYVRLGPHGPWAATPHLLPALPYTPGKDGAGVVMSVGKGVSTLKPGDRVYTTGSLTGTASEFAICAAETVHPLPYRVSFDEGACVGVPCATAFRALFLRCDAKPGDAVLIHGASGAVGLAATQLALGRGCTVVGTAGTAAGEAAVAALGAIAVNHRAEGYLEAACAALPADKEGAFDVVLEMAAHANLLSDLRVLRTGAQIAVIGSKPLPVDFNPRLLMPKEVSLHGVFSPAASADDKAKTHAALFGAMERGELTPMVGRVFALAEAARAHAEIVEPSAGGKLGNIVLRVRDPPGGAAK